jgi:Fur family peroxide stress response transcriptional regulator
MAESDQAKWVEALRGAGLRLTRQRLAMVECFADDVSHPTAQALHARLCARFPGISVATVYNTLSALTAIGACRKLELGGASRFDPNVTPHDHAVCDDCGRVRDVQRARRAAATVPGFEVHRVERVFRGLCAQCARAARV